MKSSGSPEIELRSNESIDELMNGRLKLIQSGTGYRFSIDAVLLSEFVSTRRGDTLVDLGTGCGIIPLALILARPIGYALGIEIQVELASQAARNIILNGFEGKMGVIRGDIKRPPLVPSSVDVVVCNPPYRQKNSGRINPDPQRAIARHEILVSINDILKAARRILRTKGRFAIIYPTTRLVDLMVRLRGFNLEPKRVQFVHPNLESEAKMALIEATLGGREGLKILPPIIDQGDFSKSFPA